MSSRGSLTVEKQVTGIGDREQNFQFTVTLEGVSEAGIAAEDVTGGYGEMYFENGTATFELEHGEQKTASGLPAGLRYTVTEESVSGYRTTSANAEGEIPVGGTASVSYTNYMPSPTPEDDDTDLTVQKVWRLDDGGTAPESVTVHLLRNGVIRDTITLSGQNGWRYTWGDLSDAYTWTVEEDVPSGFVSHISKDGMIFTITNDNIPEPMSLMSRKIPMSLTIQTSQMIRMTRMTRMTRMNR